MKAETILDRLHVADTKLQELSFQWANNLLTTIATLLRLTHAYVALHILLLC